MVFFRHPSRINARDRSIGGEIKAHERKKSAGSQPGETALSGAAVFQCAEVEGEGWLDAAGAKNCRACKACEYQMFAVCRAMASRSSIKARHRAASR